MSEGSRGTAANHRVLAAGLVLLWAAGLGFGLYWLARQPPELLRERLKVMQVLALEATFLALVLLTAVNLPRLLRSVRIEPGSLRTMAAISVLGLALVVGVAPRTNRIFYDEQIYMNVGQNISDLRRAQMCSSGNTEYGVLDCEIGEYNKQPYAYPYLLGLVNRVVGVYEINAYLLNNLCFVLALWVLFLTSLLLFRDASSALYGALLAATIPLLVTWSNTAASEASAALFAACAVLAAVWHARSRTMVSAGWAVAMVLFASQFRPESVLCLPLLVAILLLLAPGELVTRRIWWMGLAALPAALVFGAHLSAVSGESWGATSGSRFSLIYFPEHFRLNGLFYLMNRGFPVLYTILAGLGIWWGRRREMLVPVLWFAAFWGIFLFFYAGSYDFGADVRYSLMSYLPLALVAGVGAAGSERRLQTWMGRSARRVVVGAILLTLVSFLPLIRAVGEEAWGARSDVSAARRFAEELPPNSIVLTHNPNMFLLWGRNASQIFVVLNNPEHLDFLRKRFAGGVYFHWNYWCNTDDPVQVELCEQMADRYALELLSEERHRDYRYALYEVLATGTDETPAGN